MDFTKLANINLINGSGGGDPKAGLCIMEMVSWFDGADTVTDTPDCACPMITRVAICINDRAPSQELRNTLKPLLPLISGSCDTDNIKKRAWFVMRESAVRILAARLDRIANKVPPELAANIRAAGDPIAMRAAVQAAHKWLRAYANAYANAYTYADAYADANADAYTYADANAYANADAYADADAYAYTYTYANVYAYADANAYANAYAQRRETDRAWVFETMREILTEALKLGKHGCLDMDAPETEQRAERLLEIIGAE